MKTLIAVQTILSVVACGTPAVRTIPDDEIGLSKVDIREVSSPPAVQAATAAPGDRTPGPRRFDGSPPVISHAAVDFLPITPDDNMCLACHMVEEADEGDPTPIPESHYVDLRNRPDVAGTEVAGARYVCTTCHAPQTEAAPLVSNSFGS